MHCRHLGLVSMACCSAPCSSCREREYAAQREYEGGRVCAHPEAVCAGPSWHCCQPAVLRKLLERFLLLSHCEPRAGSLRCNAPRSMKVLPRQPRDVSADPTAPQLKQTPERAWPLSFSEDASSLYGKSLDAAGEHRAQAWGHASQNVPEGYWQPQLKWPRSAPVSRPVWPASERMLRPGCWRPSSLLWQCHPPRPDPEQWPPPAAGALGF